MRQNIIVETKTDNKTSTERNSLIRLLTTTVDLELNDFRK